MRFWIPALDNQLTDMIYRLAKRRLVLGIIKLDGKIFNGI